MSLIQKDIDRFLEAMRESEKKTYRVTGPWNLTTIKHGYYQCAFGYDVATRMHASFETISRFVAKNFEVKFPVDEDLELHGMKFVCDPLITFGELHIVNPKAILIRNHHCIVLFDETLEKPELVEWT